MVSALGSVQFRSIQSDLSSFSSHAPTSTHHSRSTRAPRSCTNASSTVLAFGGTGPRPRSQWRPCLGLFMRTSIHHNHTSHQSTIHINPSQSLVVERAPKSHDSQTPRRVGRPCVPSPLRPTPPERRPSEDGAMPLRLFPR